MHIDSTTVIDGNTEDSPYQEGNFSSSGSGENASDQYVGCEWTAQKHQS